MRCKAVKPCVKLCHRYYDLSKKSIVKIIDKLGLEISAKSFTESLRNFYREANISKGGVLPRIGIFVDRKKNVYVIIDDTPDIRYGKKVFAAAYQHNSTFNARLWQNTIVDCTIFHKGAHINNYFEVYVPIDYIERTEGGRGEKIEIRTKIEIAIDMMMEAVAWLLSLGFSKMRIHILSDSWYDSRDLIRVAKGLGVNSVQFLKRDFYARVKGRTMRIDKYFETHRKERYFKNEDGKMVSYKETRLYVPEVGYLKFFRFEEENKEEKFIATTKLDMCPKSAYRHKKMIWKIEEMHEDLKCYFGFGESYSGKEETYYAHLTICYLLFLIFWSYKIVYSDERTIEEIWWDYCMNYDKITAYNKLRDNRTAEQRVCIIPS